MRVGGLVEEVKGVGKRIGRVRLKVEGLRLLGGLGVKNEFVGERKKVNRARGLGFISLMAGHSAYLSRHWSVLGLG